MKFVRIVLEVNTHQLPESIVFTLTVPPSSVIGPC